MNAATFKAKLLALRADVDALIEKVDADGDSAEPDPIMLTPEDYAARADVSVETVRRWLKAGIPHVRRGHVVRIKVAEADAWTPSDEVLRSARIAAHKGKR
jgi:hypothetical protein